MFCRQPLVQESKTEALTTFTFITASSTIAQPSNKKLSKTKRLSSASKRDARRSDKMKVGEPLDKSVKEENGSSPNSTGNLVIRRKSDICDHTQLCKPVSYFDLIKVCNFLEMINETVWQPDFFLCCLSLINIFLILSFYI